MERLIPSAVWSHRFATTAARFVALFFSALALMLSSCAHGDPQDPDSLKISLINPEGSGRADARRDLKAGKLQLVEVPQLGLARPDEASNDPRFSNITKQHLPIEDKGRHAGAWVKYAKAYNATVIKEFEKEIRR